MNYYNGFEDMNQFFVAQEKQFKRQKRRETIGTVMMFIYVITALSKLVMEIVLKINGTLDVSIWAILCIGGGVLFPFGGVIAFIICKAVGCIALGWSWIWVPIVLDIVGLISVILSSHFGDS